MAVGVDVVVLAAVGIGVNVAVSVGGAVVALGLLAGVAVWGIVSAVDEGGISATTLVGGTGVRSGSCVLQPVDSPKINSPIISCREF